jgi:hypothetical protein
MSETKETCPRCKSKLTLIGGKGSRHYECESIDYSDGNKFVSVACRDEELAALRSQLAAESQLKEAAEKERDYYKAGYNQSPVSAKACPGCVYENGKFVRECGLHKRLCDERDGRNAAEARAAGLAKYRVVIRDVISELVDQEASGNRPHTHVDFDEQINGLVRLDEAIVALLAPAAEEGAGDGK